MKKAILTKIEFILYFNKWLSNFTSFIFRYPTKYTNLLRKTSLNLINRLTVLFTTTHYQLILFFLLTIILSKHLILRLKSHIKTWITIALSTTIHMNIFLYFKFIKTSITYYAFHRIWILLENIAFIRSLFLFFYF